MLPAELEPVEMHVIEQQLHAYGALTRDTNPIHLDPAFAATTPYGKCIAHGTLSLNALWRSIYKTFTAGASAMPTLNLDVKFSAPVFVGDSLTGGGRRVSDDSNRYEVWVKVGERVVISGELTVE